MPEATPFEAALAELAKELIAGGGEVAPKRTVSVPTQTLGGQRMRGARPMTSQERQMADNPAVQMGRDVGAAASSGVNAAGFGLPGLALDYVAPNALAGIRENEALANPGIPAIAAAAGMANAPRAAYKALAAAYGLAGAADLGAFDGAEAQSKPRVTKSMPPSLFGLTSDQMTVYLNADRRLQKGEFGSPAERRQLEATMNDLRKLSSELQLQQSSSQLKTQSDAERQKQDEYDRTVKNAETARDRELARDRRFSDTNTGKVFDATGGLAPGVFGGVAGATSRLATGGGSVAKDYVAPAALGTLAGITAANVPLIYNALYTEPDNPQKRGFDAYARELPPDHPRKAEFQQRADSMPAENPVRSVASKELYDPVKLAERVGLGTLEGIGGGLLGADVVRTMGGGTSLFGRLLRGPKGPQPGGAMPGGAGGGTQPSANALSGSPIAAPGIALEERLASTPRQLPAPTQSTSGLPSWASDPPTGVKLSPGYHWDATLNQPRHKSGKLGEMPKYSTPRKPSTE